MEKGLDEFINKMNSLNVNDFFSFELQGKTFEIKRV